MYTLRKTVVIEREKCNKKLQFERENKDRQLTSNDRKYRM